MSADLIRRLIEAGTPADLVAEVAMLAGEAAALEKRRAADRERQRNYRNGDVTLRHVTSRDVTNAPPPNERENLTPPREKPSPKGEVKKSGFAPPDGVSDDQWLAFRKQRRKPLNDRSYVLLTNKLVALAEAGWPPGEMIDLAIERGWETVFEPRNDNAKRPNSMGRHQSPDGLSPTTRAALDVFGP